MISLIPYKTGDTVKEFRGSGDDADIQLVKVINHDDQYCWTETGFKFDRLTGARVPKSGSYHAIGTPNYSTNDGNRRCVSCGYTFSSDNTYARCPLCLTQNKGW